VSEARAQEFGVVRIIFDQQYLHAVGAPSLGETGKS
jgi:hypothetical protein